MGEIEGEHRTQNTHTESKQVKLITEMIKICLFTFFFCSIAGRHFLIQTEESDGGQDYRSILSGEPLECGQKPPPNKTPPGTICIKLGQIIWGFVDGKCQQFIRGVCGAKIPGFASKDECQRACGPKKASDGGQDYDRRPGPLDPVKEALKAAKHVSDEPLKCGQKPPPPPLKKYQRCFPRIVQIWGFVDGKCKGFGINPCGYKIPGFASEEECLKGCGPKKIELKKGQDYGWAPVGRLG